MKNHHGIASTTEVHPSLHKLVTDALEFAEQAFLNSKPMPFRLTVETPDGILAYTCPCPRHDLMEFHGWYCAIGKVGERFAAAVRTSGVALICELFRCSEAGDRRRRRKQIPPLEPAMEVVKLQAESREAWTDIPLEVLRDASGRFTGFREFGGGSQMPPGFALLAKPPEAEKPAWAFVEEPTRILL